MVLHWTCHQDSLSSWLLWTHEAVIYGKQETDMLNRQHVDIIKSMSERDFKGVAASEAQRAGPKPPTEPEQRQKQRSLVVTLSLQRNILSSLSLLQTSTPLPHSAGRPHHWGLGERYCLPPGEMVELRTRGLQPSCNVMELTYTVGFGSGFFCAKYKHYYQTVNWTVEYHL